jgi:Raf kinase inhibitor-like YbhB/YbcL family protein
MAFYVTSPLFTNGQAIPTRFTRAGENVSPPLLWRGAPAEARSFALILEDTDVPAGQRLHWVAFDIAADHLAEGAGAPDTGLRMGRNAFGAVRYDGPAPAPDETVHTYRFRLAALSVPSLSLPHGAAGEDVWEAAQRRLLSEVELIALYSRLDVAGAP